MKKRFLSILIIVCLLFGFTFAPNNFVQQTSGGLGNGTGGTTVAATMVDSLSKLYAEGQDEVGNNTGYATAARKTLLLGADLTLTADMTLTADLALDLGTHILNLDGHNLTVRHNYSGSVIVANGTVESGDGGKIVLVTPSADAVLTAANATNAFDKVGSVTMATANKAERTAALAQSFAEAQIQSGGCEGAYRTNVDLPMHFGTLGTLSYTSNLPSVLSNSGRVTATAATNAAVTLTPTFTPENGAAVSGTAISVQIIGSDNASGWSSWINSRVIAPVLGSPDGSGKYEISYDTSLPVTGVFAEELSYTLTVGGTTAPIVPTVTTEGGKYAVIDHSIIKNSDTGVATLKVEYGGNNSEYTLVATKGVVVSDPVSEIIMLLFHTDNPRQLVFAEQTSTMSGYSEYPVTLTQNIKDKYALTDLSMQLNYNYNGTYQIFEPDQANDFYGTVRIVPGKVPQPDDSVTLAVGFKLNGVAQERTLALIFTGSTSSDSQANPSRFQTHYSYFEQQVRDSTHQVYDVDMTFSVSATKVGSIPSVAFRVCNSDGSTYTTPASSGGISVTFTGVDGIVYEPVYGADGVFTGLKDGASVLSMVDSMKKFGASAKWTFTIDPTSRNHKEGKVDEDIFLEYQYSFASNFTDSAKTYWFSYTDEADSSVKVGNRLTLLSLVLAGTDAAAFDFPKTTALDVALYNGMIDAFSPNYSYLPYKKIIAARSELNVKALLYPDKNLFDSIDNGDVSGGEELDSIMSGSTRQITHYNWLSLMIGVERLNLHGMHIDDSVVSSQLLTMTWLKGLDVSGVYENGYDYNEKNSSKPAIVYSERTSQITTSVLKDLFISLSVIEELNIAYCRITDFADLGYLSASLKSLHMEGNTTGGGDPYNNTGSTGAKTQLPAETIAARADVYRSVADPTATIIASKDVIQNLNKIRALAYQKKIPKPSPDTEANRMTIMNQIKGELPVFTTGSQASNDLKSVSVSYVSSGTGLGSLQYDSQTVAYEVHSSNEIWLPVPYKGTNSHDCMFYLMRFQFEFI